MFIRKDEINVPEAREQLVQRICSKVRESKEHFKGDFNRMLDDMDILRNGCRKPWDSQYDYVVNITQRFVKQKVASLYAKNPRAVAKRSQRLEYKHWNGEPQQILDALQAMKSSLDQTGQPDAFAQQLIMDVADAKRRKDLYERIGKTMEILWRYYTEEQSPPFKGQMKSTVRGAVAAGVGYVKLGIQREKDYAPETGRRIADAKKRLAYIERLQTELSEGEKDVHSAEAEELRLSLQRLVEEQQITLREGLVWDFPFQTSIIPDMACTALKGWEGADFLAEELYLTPDEVKEYYKVDLQISGDDSNYRPYSTRNVDFKRNPRADLDGQRQDMACVWVVQHKPTGLVFTVCDGHPDFLKEPEPPAVQIERFFTVYALTFNENPHPTSIFPISDVRMMLPQQEEMNRTRQGLREHRMANRPGYAYSKGAIDPEDAKKLSEHEAHDAVALGSLMPGQKLADVLGEIPKQGVDPNLYESGPIFDDIMWQMGAQEATFGGVSKSTATEASIAETSRTTSLEADIDELNDFLTELARDAGVVMLSEISPETATKIAGPGAVWPRTSVAEAQAEVYLTVVAGSNGRPNKAQRQYALQQLAPMLIQTPGVSPHWFVKMLVEAIDDSIDLTEAYIEGIPSIQSMNGMSQPGTGDPRTSPEQQGPQGANNAPQERAPGGTGLVPMGGQNQQSVATRGEEA